MVYLQPLAPLKPVPRTVKNGGVITAAPGGIMAGWHGGGEETDKVPLVSTKEGGVRHLRRGCRCHVGRRHLAAGSVIARHFHLEISRDLYPIEVILVCISDTLFFHCFSPSCFTKT